MPPRINTRSNSLKSAKSNDDTSGSSSRSRRSTLKSAAAKSSSQSKTPSKRTRTAKSETPKRLQKNKDEKTAKGKENVRGNKEKISRGNENVQDNKAKKAKGKENVRDNKEKKAKKDKKRLLEEDDEEGDNKGSVAETPKKRRRIILPEEGSEDEVDSGDEYKPDDDAESDEDDDFLSVVDSESEPHTDSDSEDESPKKKRRANGGTAKGTAKSTAKITMKSEVHMTLSAETATTGKASDTQSWPHLKYDFLQPDKIKDNKQRPRDHPDYDPKTLYVPLDFLDKQTPAMRQWWVLKSDYYDCVLFFKVGKFYELYHMDAITGAEQLNVSFMRGEFAHCGFPEIMYGRYSSSLIERGYKIARIEQTENPEMAANRCSKMEKFTKFDKVVKREVCQISTRGTRIYTAQDSEASGPTSNYLLAIVEKQTASLPSYGVCFIDTSIGDFYVGQFQDDRCNSRLLTLLAHYPPVHIIYERNGLSPATLKIINSFLPGAMKEALQKEVQFWSATKVLKALHENDYFKKEGEANFEWPKGLQPYLNKTDNSGFIPAEDKVLAVRALGGCVYLLTEYKLEQQLLAQGVFKTYCPPDFEGIENKSKRQTRFAHNMVLDAITINNLRILGSDGSLIDTLDKCCTPFGKRLIREWICRPSCRKGVIVERQEAITELLDNPKLVAEVRSKLSTLPDLERLLSQIHAYGNAAKLRNHPDGRAIMLDVNRYAKKKVIDLLTVLNGFENVLQIVGKFEGFKSPLIKKHTQLEPKGDFPDLKDTLKYFKNAFNHEQAKKEGFIIPKHGVDRDYDAVLLELADIKKESEEYLAKQSKHFGVQIKYCGNDKKQFQIEVPKNQESKAGEDYEQQGSRKGFIRYYTPETREFNAKQIAAEEEKEMILKDINRRIFAQFSESYDQWCKAAYNIAVLDCLISLTEYAGTCEVCVPTIYDDTDEGEIMIEIRDGKHPCIQTKNFISNDTLMATDGTAPLILLTGPNMGGKSTLMRQVGLLTIMAQIGCHVPASVCRLTMVDRIFTRLGANDDIMAGQSTFLVELSETAAILQHATTYSLVLLDELGRGTSTYDGTAIAASVVNALTKKKCRTLFSTHYHSLIEDFKDNKNVSAAHMACMVENEDENEVTEQNVTFLYKLSQGACPKSYGFNAARLAGIPAEVTKRAQVIATKLEHEVNLRHAFTAICRIDDNESMKSLMKNFKSL